MLCKLHIHLKHLLVRAVGLGLVCATLSFTLTSRQILERAVQLIQQGKLEEARQLVQLTTKDPEVAPVAYSILGGIYLQQQNLPKAEEYLKQALELNPDLPGAWLNLGHTYWYMGDAEKARECYQKAVTLTSGNFQAVLSLALVERSTGNCKRVIELLRTKTIEVSKSEDAFLTLAGCYESEGRKQEFFDLMRSAGWAQSFSPPVKLQAAFWSVELGLKDGLRKLLAGWNAAMEEVPQEQLPRLGLVYELAGELEKAELAYQKCLSQLPKPDACLLGLARVAERNGQLEKALSWALKAQAAAPRDAENRFLVGKLCLQLDLIQDAKVALQEAVELDPGNPRYRYALASALISSKDFDGALEIFKDLSRLYPNDVALLYNIGATCYLKSDYRCAEEYLKRSLEKDSSQVAPRYYLGQVYQAIGRFDEAIKLLKEAIELNPAHAVSYEALGTLLLKKGKLQEARQTLEKALELNPELSKAHYQLGLVLARLGDKEAGKAHIELSRELSKKQVERAQLRIDMEATLASCGDGCWKEGTRDVSQQD